MTSPTPEPSSNPVVFLLDCDNTLLDNDTLKADMAAQLHALLGQEMSERFWQEYEEVRRLTGIVDLPLTFERFAPLLSNANMIQRVEALVMDYPFERRLYPETLETLRYLRTIGLPTIVSDGDTVYQPRKIERSGLAEAVNWQAVVYAHKEDHLQEIMARWPGRYYVTVDDKARILAALKRLHPDRFVTVQVMQGHYASATTQFAPPPDITIAHIGDLCAFGPSDFARHLAAAPEALP
jgi:beta-phosphoglucomutase-like phosphatase (HAD superfamily)